MSDFQAIGGVSETLRALLEDRMELPAEAQSGFTVTIGPPKSDVAPNQPETAEQPRVNLFLYKIAENGALKNQEIPGHGSPGAYGFPPLSLSLYYLLTAYGTRDEQGRFSETLAHFLLGSAMRVFHDVAIVTDDLRSVRHAPVGDQILHETLRGEFERVKLSLEPISLEDLSKVWTALTMPFRVAAAYHVSAVQIESRRQRGFPRRVGEPPPAGPRITVVPFKVPSIEQISVHWQSDPPGTEKPFPFAAVGDTLILRGLNFVSPSTLVRIGRLEIRVTPIDDTRLQVNLPDDTLPGGVGIAPVRRLQPGPQTVEVLTGLTPLRSTVFPSNQAVFMLTPLVTAATPNLGVVPRTLQITGTRLFHEHLTGEAVVGRAVIPKDLYTSASPTQITFALADSLVAFPVTSRVSGVVSPFPAIASGSILSLTIGADGPHAVRLPRPPADIADAAVLLEAAIRVADDGGPAFKGTRVAATTDDRLVIIPGRLQETVDFTLDAVSGALKLDAAQSTTPQLYLSGELEPFPVMTADNPQVNLTIGGTTRAIALGSRPLSLAETVAQLETAIRSFVADPAFAGARVVAADSQIALVPGAAGAVTFDQIAGVDQSTVGELELLQDTAVRVRVNGAESLQLLTVDLTA
jgi:hypothetical protein